MDDVQSMFDNWASDENVTRHLTWAPHSDIGQTTKYIESMISKYESGDYYDWLIESEETGDVIGSIGFVRCFEDIDAFDVGYVLGRRWWGQGIMPEALTAVIEYAFTRLGAKRIGAQCDEHNRASEQVMKKCNLRYEGRIRKGARNNRGIVDILQYSIIAADFAASQLADPSKIAIRKLDSL